jgi:ribokinase
MGQSVPRLAIRGLTGGGYEMSLRAFFRVVSARGPRHVVLTDGGEGAFAATGNDILYAKARVTDVAGTAGAGDAFAATYAGFIAWARPPAEALRAATLNSAAVLRYVDTQSGLLRSEDLEPLLAAGKGEASVMNWPL